MSFGEEPVRWRRLQCRRQLRETREASQCGVKIAPRSLESAGPSPRRSSSPRVSLRGPSFGVQRPDSGFKLASIPAEEFVAGSSKATLERGGEAAEPCLNPVPSKPSGRLRAVLSPSGQ